MGAQRRQRRWERREPRAEDSLEEDAPDLPAWAPEAVWGPIAQGWDSGRGGRVQPLSAFLPPPSGCPPRPRTPRQATPAHRMIPEPWGARENAAAVSRRSGGKR